MPGMTMITVTVSSIPYDLALPDDNDQESMMIHIGEDSSGAVYALMDITPGLSIHSGAGYAGVVSVVK